MDKFGQAYIVAVYDAKIALVKVPVILDDAGVPDVPRLIVCNGWYAYLKAMRPLTYVWIEGPVDVEKIKGYESTAPFQKVAAL
jgi:hypothetical protein